MAASYRPRAQSMDGYRSCAPNSHRLASFNRPEVSYYHSRRHSASYTPAGLPPQHRLPQVHNDQYDIIAAPYEEGPAVVTRWPIGRRAHGVSPRNRMEVELAKQARRQGGGHGVVGVPMQMPAPDPGVKLSISAALRQANAAAIERQLLPMAPQMDIPGVRADPLMMAAIMGQMHAEGGNVGLDMRNVVPEARAEEAVAMVHRGHGKKKKHVHFQDFKAPFANLFRGRGHHRREIAKDISVPGYSLVKKLSPGGMSDAVNLVKNKSTGKLYIEKRVRFANGRHQDLMKRRAQAELRALRKRIAKAASDISLQQRRPLYYLDLNAISPRSAREIGDLFGPSAASIRYIDGGIIGGPPKLKEDGTWSRPSVPVSGPHRLEQAPVSGQHLAHTLNIRHINETIGSAAGLKMCFASLSKGFTALAIQSLTTAHSLGVSEELMFELEARNPGARKQVESVTNMAPKAYRWVREMEEIAETFEADGGFESEESIFRPIAKVYELVANGTELGLEKTEERKRGKTTEDVALLMSEGIARRKEKVE